MEPVKISVFNNIITLNKGDITKLKVECIVNASNPSGLGCFTPNHPCIDNKIHKIAGLSLLEECKTLGGIPTGIAKITRGYNLPAKFIIHCTGPKITDEGYEDHKMLSKYYFAILDLAVKNGIKEIALCGISSGMYGFSKQRAAETAVNSVNEWILRQKRNNIKIIFNVYTDVDYKIYEKILGDKYNSSAPMFHAENLPINAFSDPLQLIGKPSSNLSSLAIIFALLAILIIVLVKNK